ncbi:ABC transporter permease subunit [Methylobacterium sp. M6A4_1b]
MTADPRQGGTGRAGIRPLLAATAWFGALAIALTRLPLLSVAENRLALGHPVTGLAALGTTGFVVLALGAGAIGLAATSRGRGGAAAAVLLLVLATLLLGQGLGRGAALSLAGLPPAARTSLGPGCWLALALLGGALGLAVRRARIPGLGLATGVLLSLALATVGRMGAFDALSLAVEYAARRGTVNAAIAEHLALAGAALLLACLLAVGLSLTRRGQGLVALVLGGLQVVPAVALLGAMVAAMAGLLRAVPALRDLGLSALGPVPAVVAIAAYLALPLWRGLALALRAPDADTLQAAEAVGLSRGQILARIRLPIGAPILVGAVRVAAVQGLGLATLGALVGGGGLGRIVFDGMAQFAPDLILLGAIPVVVLSLLAERGLSRLEAAARRRWHA